LGALRQTSRIVQAQSSRDRVTVGLRRFLKQRQLLGSIEELFQRDREPR
jgi:hypothetical protein